jgi:hypothetical protein
LGQESRITIRWIILAFTGLGRMVLQQGRFQKDGATGNEIVTQVERVADAPTVKSGADASVAVRCADASAAVR